MYISKIYVILICFTALYSYQKEESIKNSFSYYMNNSNENLSIIGQNDNNVFLAPLLSVVLPGAGQIYNKDYKRGYFYLSLEILSWLYRKNYLSKSENYEINLETGLYFGKKNTFVENKNIFISGMTQNENQNIKWILNKI